ncbi:MAG TPA: hybrid sensor histidine kinase/response regulator [Polyangiaceae bacterium]|nr:hybrid sensor histidine kinase/response regulator [Polyangiaceae bacterium]
MMSAPQTSNILVVDDKVENLRLLANILESLDYEVRPATSGRSALLAAERDPPDLVLLDVNMPDMNGYEVCVAFKARPRLKDIPVIFLTALNEVADKVKAFAVGGVDFVSKPFHIDEVHARVKTHLDLRRAHLELEASYEKLKQLEQLRDDLVHMVVHDMRSPLTVLGGHLACVQVEANRLSREATEDLRAAMLGVQALTRMANDLLDVSRLEEGKLPLELADHDLVEMAADVQSAMREFERGKRLELLASEPLHVNCDRNVVRRVLENLVSNAIKHASSTGAVRIELSRTPTGARLCVCDDGPGVPAQARQRIFEKFGTIAARRANGYHSAGLGLAFCKLAIEAHGGRIGVEDGRAGGSRFWFELPREP